MRFVWAIVLVASSLGLLPTASAAHDIAGSWYGLVQGWEREPRRVLTVRMDAGNPTCTFAAPNYTGEAAAPCTVSGNVLEIETATQVKVRLTLSGSSLAGTFTPPRGQRSLQLVMTREPQALDGPGTRRYTVQACDQSLDLVMMPPLPSAPPVARAFSGLWKGTWEFGRCIAVAVESISPGGNASVLIAFGNYGSYPRQADRYSGRLQNSSLKTYFTQQGGLVQGIKFNVEMTIEGANTMRWISFGRDGRGLASLSKQ